MYDAAQNLLIRECTRNVEQLENWLAAHPERPDWPEDMRRAREDRLTSLRLWTARLSLALRGE